MRKFLRLSLLTAVLTLVMSAAVWAEEITQDTTLDATKTYTDLNISGGNVTVTVPKGVVTVASSSTSALQNGTCITIASGNVTIKGAEDGAAIQYGGTTTCGSLIYVMPGASLTLNNVTIDGNNPNNGSSNGKYYYGINNEGDLTVEDGTVIKNFTTVSYSKFGSGVYNKGTFNMTGGEICNNAFVLGGGVSVYGPTNISGGTIHDNTNYSIYHSSGDITITGGLMVGNTAGKYDVTGVYKSGPIKLSASVGNNPITIVDETENKISVTAKNGDYFVANPEHKIVATIDNEPHSAIYYDNSWHFINAEHDAGEGHDHEIHLDTNKAYMFVGDEKTIIATVVCSNKNYEIDDPVITGDAGVVTVTRDDTATVRADQTAFKLKAERPGKADIAFITNDKRTQDVLTVQVTDPNVIESDDNNKTKPKNEMDPTKTYVNTKIIQKKGSLAPSENSAMVVTVPAQGIKAGSTNGFDCITIEEGAVKLTGGTITHVNDGTHSSRSLIKVKSGAILVLENITIDGGWKTGEPVKDLLLYGIDIEKGATLIIKKGTVINGIDVETDVEENAILYNNGTLKIEGGAIYGNDNKSYVIYNNNGGTVTVDGGITVGKVPEGQIQAVGGNNKSGILGGNIGGPITANLGKDETLEFEANAGDYVMTGSNTKLISEDGREAKYIEATHRWDFTDALKAEVSFVRGTATQGSATGNFSKTHYTDINGKREESDDLSDTYSVSTGFYVENEDVNIDENGKAYVVFDILFPADKTVYFNTNNKVEFGGAVHKKGFDLKKTAVFEPDGGQNLTEARNSVYSNEIKGKYTIDAAEGDTLFGVIVDGVYAPDAIAYISTCTAEQYAKATGYEEVKGDNGETQIAVVSLELE